MKLLVVLNPISGDTDKTEWLRYARDRCRHFGIALSLYRTTGQNDVESLRACVADEQPDRIASVGGDGTFKLVVEATADQPVPTGIIPAGSANGMARELGVPEDLFDAFDELVSSRLVEPMDLLVVNGEHHCIHMGDVGLNARIVSGFEADSSRGMVAYGRALFRALSEMEPFNYTLHIDGAQHVGKAVMLGFGNGSKFGTGIPLNTVGNPFDGKFEVTVIEELNADMLLRAGLSLLNETFLREAETKVYSGQSAQIQLQQKQRLQVDGEMIGETDRVEIGLEPGAVKLVTTRANRYL